MPDLDIDRLTDVMTELTDALVRFNESLNRLEEARAHHTEVVAKLTDERFKSVTR